MEPAAPALLLSSADAALAVAPGRCRPSPPPRPRFAAPGRRAVSCRSVRARAAAATAPAAGSINGENNGGYTVGDFMTKRENLHVVKPSTSIDEGGLADTSTSMFPDVDSTWKTFCEIQRLLSKTNGDVMTSSPLVVRENTNLDAASRLLLETKYSRLPVVDSTGKLVGMITRGNVVRAALKIKKEAEEGA